VRTLIEKGFEWLKLVIDDVGTQGNESNIALLQAT